MTTAVITKEPLAIVSLIHNDTPDPVFWPDGSATHGTAVGYTVGGWQLASLQYDVAPNRFYVEASPPAPVSLDGFVLRMSRRWQPVPLQEARDALLVEVDAAAEARRQAYVTPGAGQAMVYMQKLAQASTFLAAQNPTPTDYPLLNATVGVEGATITDVANLVVQIAGQWTTIAASIEKVRLTAKAAINAAQTVDAALAAFTAIVWP